MDAQRTACSRVAPPPPVGVFAAVTAALLILSAVAPSARAGEVKQYQTPYYVLHTDLSPEDVQETSLRMSRMFEEYLERTKQFSGKPGNKKLPFYLFRERADYEKAGGMPGSAGVFMTRGTDKKLMAIAGEELSDRTWHVVQHEGFHQFADATIGELPTWVNEGLAEYFGEGVWTGDGFVVGVVPPRRLEVIQEGIREKGFRPLPAMMQVTLREWNLNLAAENYHQAWAMSHFLAHADDGKYQAAFVNFVRGVNKKVPWQKAWEQSFGSAAGFEKVWAEWWLKQDPAGTDDLRTRATLCTLASYAARAQATKQLPTELPGLIKAVESGELKFKGDLWLPPSLFARAAKEMKRDKSKFSFVPAAEKNQPPKLLAERPDGVRMTASFPARITSLPVKIAVEVDDLAPLSDRAEEMIKAGKKKEAKALLADGLKRCPKSPAAERAKKLLAEAK